VIRGAHDVGPGGGGRVTSKSGRCGWGGRGTMPPKLEHQKKEDSTGEWGGRNIP